MTGLNIGKIIMNEEIKNNESEAIDYEKLHEESPYSSTLAITPSEGTLPEFSYIGANNEEVITKPAITYDLCDGGNGGDGYLMNLLDMYQSENVFSKVDLGIKSESDLTSAISEGGLVQLNGDLVLEAPLTITKNATLNLNNRNLTCPKGDVLVVTDGELVINGGSGTVFGSSDNSSSACAVWAKENGTVVINSGIFKVGDDESSKESGNWRNDCIYVRDNAHVIINGGVFMYAGSNPEGQKFLLNCRDADFKAGTCSIEVKGGTFYGFDPGNHSSEVGSTSFLAEGYKSLTRDNGRSYIVVKA